MKKSLFALLFAFSLALFRLPVQAADPLSEIPVPPDIETLSPPPDNLTNAKTNDPAVPAPPALPTATPEAKASDMEIPPPPSVESPKPAAPAGQVPSGSDADLSVPPPPSAPAAEAPQAPAAAKPPVTAAAPERPKTAAPKAKGKKAPLVAAPTQTPTLAQAVLPPTATSTPAPSEPTMDQQVAAYRYAYELYAAQQFAKAKEYFRKIAMVSEDPILKSNSYYYYSQCAFRTEDYLGCVKGLKVMVKKTPGCAAIQKGFVTRFCVFLIDQCANLQTNWDYFRYQVGTDEKGEPVWKESIPPGPKIKRINFRLAFGLYNVLHTIQPDSPEDLAAKQKLQRMLDTPITVLWVDEKAPKKKLGHPGDFLSVFSTNEKKDFSKVICERMFYDFQTEYFYRFLDMHDDLRNLRPRFVAVNKPVKEGALAANVPAPPEANMGGGPITTAIATEEDSNKILTLYNLLHVAGYYPWLDSYTNTIEAAPTDLNL